jgi:protocadherin Fat 4
VTATGPGGAYSDTTGPDGCATFVLSTVGAYTIALADGASYVSFNGATTATATVAAGSLTVRQFSYDLGESFSATLTPPTGFSLPVTLPTVTVGNSGITPSGVTSFTSTAGGTTVIGPLWPFASGYAIWAGSCTGSDPALEGARPAAIVPTRGTTTTTTAALQGLAITTTDHGTPTSATVTATYAGTGTCPAGDSVIVLGTSAGGVLNASLPYGTWSLASTTVGVTPQVVTVTNTGAVAVTLDGH